MSQCPSITRLVSFLTAKSDPGTYGRLQSFVMPQDIGAVEGPVQAALQPLVAEPRH